MDEENKMQSLIVIRQLPVIQEELKQLKAEWDQKAKDAAALVCTEETVQELKAIRAEMRKEFEAADAQRKAAKAAYMAPWDAVERTFRECVKDSFDKADTALKAQKDAFEGALKEDCRKRLEAFFDEMCAMESIDFLTFEQALKIWKINISLTDAKRNTPTKLQDQIAAVVADVATNMDAIRKMDEPDEIMAEYKFCLDLGRAVSVVQERRRRIAAEKEAAEARKAAQERFQQAADKVEAALPPVESEAEQEESEPVFEEYTFTVFNVTRSQLLRVREFLKKELIQYE